VECVGGGADRVLSAGARGVAHVVQRERMRGNRLATRHSFGIAAPAARSGDSVEAARASGSPGRRPCSSVGAELEHAFPLRFKHPLGGCVPRPRSRAEYLASTRLPRLDTVEDSDRVARALARERLMGAACAVAWAGGWGGDRLRGLELAQSRQAMGMNGASSFEGSENAFRRHWRRRRASLTPP
jgi:hypothetical protein